MCNFITSGKYFKLLTQAQFLRCAYSASRLKLSRFTEDEIKNGTTTVVESIYFLIGVILENDKLSPLNIFAKQHAECAFIIRSRAGPKKKEENQNR